MKCDLSEVSFNIFRKEIHTIKGWHRSLLCLLLVVVSRVTSNSERRTNRSGKATISTVAARLNGI